MPWNDPNTRLDQATLSLKWCIHLIDALVRQGVQQAFISPGSRSTPLTLALVHHPGIRCHSVLDERSAAFMALGAGKTWNETGTQKESDRYPSANPPALFVCTSGTAVANAFPAVVEARMSASPLLVLTADRPPNLRATGSSQTIDQIKIFGDYPVFFFDAGEPVDTPEDFKRLDRLGIHAVTLARIKKGPVHLNLPFRKPLEPSNEQIRQLNKIRSRQTLQGESSRQFIQDESSLQALQDDSPTGKPHSAAHTGGITIRTGFIDNESVRSVPKTLSGLITESHRPLIIAGSGTRYPDPFWDWCRNHHIPVLAETGGISGAVYKHPLVLQNPDQMKSLKPDLVLRTGGAPVHRPTIEFLQHLCVPQVLFGDHPDLPDASLSATHLFPGAAGDYDWTNFKPDSGSFEDYEQQWQLARHQMTEKLSEILNAEPRLTDPHIYHHLLPLLAEFSDTRVVTSNSFPIRDYLLFGPDHVISLLPLLVNRGASGIDGVTSTAIGSALASGQPTVLLTGDLAFLHDAGALNNLTSRKLKLKIVVINNRGGSIFRMLPFDKHDATFTEFFETPQQVDISNVAGAHGIPFTQVDSVGDLQKAWKRLDRYPAGILECRTDTEASMNLRHTVSHLF